uniref:H0404F02.7 protein n=1 Tax=Oryza sativa TaxID=4530 RepID=Q01KJ0_ORYSA|nr:H0404F02.7 [Oryza sativa]
MTAPVTTTTSSLLLLHQPAAAIRSLPSPPRPSAVARPGRSRRRALLRCSAVSELAPTASAAYGVLLLGGGAFAYVRSGSKGSIFGGLSGSALMGIAYYLMQSPETKALGDAVGFGSAFLFASVFGIRLYNTRKLVPSGLLLVLSLGALGVFYSAYMQDKV